MKKHQCVRCKRHVSKVLEVAKKTGSRREYCEACIQTMRNKGANVSVIDRAKRIDAQAHSDSAAAIANASNRK